MEKHIYTSLSAEEFTQTIKECILEVLTEESIRNSKKEIEEELISIEDVQKIFQVSKVTIHKWKKLGLLPFYKVNRKLYFKKSEVIDSLKNKKRKFTP